MPLYRSFDFADMQVEIYRFETGRTANEILTSLNDGSHMYFRYLSDLVTSSQSPGSTLKDTVYLSLEPFLSDFIDYWREFDLNHATPSLLEHDIPLSQSFMDFPDEIKMHIIGAIPCTDLLALRVVNKQLWELITPITHSWLCFRMPPGSTAFADSSMTPHKWASGAELLGAIFVLQAWFPIVSMSYNSWPIRNHCFFKFLSNAAVTRVAITGYRYTNYFIPMVPFPFMLPSTVRDLRLVRCSLMGHSLLGLLSPGTQLDSLEFDHVDDGFVVHIITPADPSASEINIWHELNGLHSFRQQLMKKPPTTSLRRLKINFAPFTLQGMLHVELQPTYYQPDYMQELLISQLFCVPKAQRIVRPYLQAGEHFPVHLKLSSLIDLDLCMGPFVYRHVRWGWAELKDSLTTLIIRDCVLQFANMGDSHAHLPLSGLHALEHVKLVAPVSSIQRMLWSVVSWSAPAKELTMATLSIIAFMWHVLLPS
ncbi:hypothetical protein EDD18DRAFT_1344255 [Armillaria luteobubalina]|uniref:F-box domain-containing protein n=1 Tax=Armillaria luteobubalina TaxID=153913 RepID=A0AA39QM29_9AGAR|nr:hypothetical protein EDD18DRAFT_1344255 [Armillaria luteobubalina]